MYLKSIEVHGFKSFAHKLVFEFKDGITAIVGPNGSGKSNVADAVRWVLGEQSAKQLRGNKMEDVIFSGTETRKPLGFAYVAITFDNSDHSMPLDYDTVTVARRVYRSGESEYLINGATCLLKDIKEMFFDTGIGKEGYSIIGQGQIDKILSGKPEERRELFDEAAGIVKYKRRKMTTLKNLDAEHQNLLRVNDILNELELQVGPLSVQAEKARKFLDLREELKSKQIQLFIIDYERLEKELSKMKEKQDIAKKDLEETNEKYAKSRERLDQLESDIETTLSEIDKLKNTINENLIKAKQLEGDVNVYEEQIESARQNKDTYNIRLSEYENRINEGKTELEKLAVEKAQLEEKLSLINKQKSEAEENINSINDNIHKLEGQIRDYNRLMIETVNDSSDIKAEAKKFETLLEQSSIKKAETNANIIRIKTELSGLEDEIAALKDKAEELGKDIAKKKKLIDSTRYNILENERKTRLLEEKKSAIQNDYHKINSQIATLKNISERYEGYGQSIKKVMEQKKDNKGVIGVVADIINVNAKYETAVETALGGNIQNIVTDNSKTAKQMVEFLKKNKLGRATFLPLSDITADADYDKKLDKEPGVLGPVCDFIKTDSKYKEIVKYLTGRFVLVDNIDNALKLSSKYSYTLRIVTIEGEFLNVGGSISGGAFKNKSNLLGRKREINELEAKLEGIKKELNDIKETQEKYASENRKYTEQQTVYDAELQDIMLKHNTVVTEMNQLESVIKKSKEDYENTTAEAERIEKQSIDVNSLLKESALKVEDNDRKLSEYRETINTLSAELDTVKVKQADAGEVLNKFIIDITALSRNESFVDENIARIQGVINDANTNISQLHDEKAQTKEKIEERKNIIKNVKESIDNLYSYTEKLEGRLADLTKKRDELTQKQKSARDEREQISEIRNNLEKEQIRIQNQNEKFDDQFSTLNQYMWNEYELTYRSALQYRSEDIPSYTALKKSTNELRSAIKNLGDVNVNAIEEYASVSERYNVMKKQHDDIVESEEKLVGFIDELEEKMRKQFTEKFEEIKEQYNIVFRELFGGGKGTIELTEGEDVLDAGIHIIAQPPGKTLKSMSMLSGGEKAMTAIAVLFAIQNLKPSPFCLLDEIEAALDDINVKRFAKYLSKLKNKTQYIVITHRQGTMETADVLYGITMQEKGVSTLVSVDLVEGQLEKEGKS